MDLNIQNFAIIFLIYFTSLIRSEFLYGTFPEKFVWGVSSLTKHVQDVLDTGGEKIKLNYF